MLFQERVPLAPYTTFKIGGPARWFAEATTEAEVAEGVEFARSRDLRLFVLGGGSNLLVSDAGFLGLVLHMVLKGIREEPDGSHRIVSAAAGENWDDLVGHAVSCNYQGIECLAGIPGTVGGTPVQNVGAYGQEVASTIIAVRALDTELDRFVDLSPEECGFAYRSSIFNGAQRGRYIVTRVAYRLASGAPPEIFYRDLVQYFKVQYSKEKPAPTIADVAGAVREIRRRKGMLIVPGDPDCLSAGSFFKNPVVPAAALDRIQQGLPNSSTEAPSYPAGDGMVKIPAAWLVEQAGFHKGFELGRAGISSRHSLALINRGGASAGDIAALRDEIVAAVLDRFGVRLQPEPVWVS